MDITSYLLGKKAGGGGSGGLTEITDAYHLFNNGHRLSQINEILPLVKKPTDCNGMFSGCTGLEGTLDLSQIDFSTCTEISSMFSYSSYLSYVTGINNVSNVTRMQSTFSGVASQYNSGTVAWDLSNWNVKNVTTMNGMFNSFGYNYADPVSTINLSNWDLDKCVDTSYMFSSCNAIMTLSNWKTTKVTNMSGMFQSCSKITELDLSSFETPLLTNTTQMFNASKNLTKIDMRKFDFSGVTSYSNMFGMNATSGVPDNCLIIVADDTQKTWITSKFSRLTNVKTVAEYEAS